MGCSSTRRKKGCNVLVPAFMQSSKLHAVIGQFPYVLLD